MKGPSLQRTALFSAALHATALLVAALAVRQPIRIITPSPYVVDLVSPAAGGREGTAEAPDLREAAAEAPTASSAVAQEERKSTKEDLGRVNDRLSELRAKKQIEKIVKMRNMLSVGRSTEKAGKGSPAAQGQKAGGGSIVDVYYSKLIQEIRREWAFPDLGNSTLEAIVSVKVGRDGTLTVMNIEKSSGNALFDRSALRALTKASPVTAPPYEMELGIRFFP